MPNYTEATAIHWLEKKLAKEGFGSARPVKDHGIDLIAYTDIGNNKFHAVPLQVKAADEARFVVERKYAGRGIVMTYIWHAHSRTPRLFLVPYEDAVKMLPEQTQQAPCWVAKGIWSVPKPGKIWISKLEPFENRFDLLRLEDK